MAQFQITVSNYEHGSRTIKIVGLVGAADSSNVAEVNEAILKFFSEVKGPLDLIIDATNLEYINSTFIGHLTDWYSRLGEKDGKLLLANMKPNVEDTLSTVGLLGLIQHFGNIAEAKLALTENMASNEPAEQNQVVI